MTLVSLSLSTIYTYATSDKEQSKDNNVIVGGEGEELILEMQGVDSFIDPEILQFKIPSTNYTQICPSNQCEIEDTYTYLSGPSPDDSSPYISVRIDLNLIDDITNANLTPAQKLFIEKFSFNIFCKVSSIDQIVQDSDGNVVYNCEDNSGGASLGPVETSSNLTSLAYSYKVTYDTKSKIMKLNGKLDHIQN